MLKPTDGIYPSATGYTFIDSTGTRLEGGNLPDLIQRVGAWRKLNGLHPGNPEAEVHEFLCKRNPGLCRGGVAAATAVPDNSRRLAERVLAWLGRIGSAFTRPERVPDGVIEARVAACRQCRYNKEYTAACAGCSAGSLAVRGVWTSGTAGTLTAGAFGCAQYGFDAAVAAQLSFERLPPDRHAPDGCWRSNR